MFPPSPVAIKITDTDNFEGCDFKVSLNSMMKHPFSESVVNRTLFPKAVTAGALKPLDCILQWIVSRIIRPKMGGYSRVDHPEVHLVYAIKNKMRIN